MDGNENKRTSNASYRSQEVDESEKSKKSVVGNLSNIDKESKVPTSHASEIKLGHVEQSSQIQVTSLDSVAKGSKISENGGSNVWERKESTSSGKKGISFTDRSEIWVTESDSSSVSESKRNLDTVKRDNVVSETKSIRKKSRGSREGRKRQSIKNDSSDAERIVPHIEAISSTPTPNQQYDDKEMNSTKFTEDARQGNGSSRTHIEKTRTSRSNTIFKEYNKEEPEMYTAQSLTETVQYANPFGKNQLPHNLSETVLKPVPSNLVTKDSPLKIQDSDKSRYDISGYTSRRESLKEILEPEIKRDIGVEKDRTNEPEHDKSHLQNSSEQLKSKTRRRSSNSSNQLKHPLSESESGKNVKRTPSNQLNVSRESQNTVPDSTTEEKVKKGPPHDVSENRIVANTHGTDENRNTRTTPAFEETFTPQMSELTYENLVKTYQSQESIGSSDDLKVKQTRKTRRRSSDGVIRKRSQSIDGLGGDKRTEEERKLSSKSEPSLERIVQREIGDDPSWKPETEIRYRKLSREKQDQDYSLDTPIATKKSRERKSSQDNPSLRIEESESLKPKRKSSLTPGSETLVPTSGNSLGKEGRRKSKTDSEQDVPGIVGIGTGQEHIMKRRRSSKDVEPNTLNNDKQVTKSETRSIVSKSGNSETPLHQSASCKHSGVAAGRENLPLMEEMTNKDSHLTANPNLDTSNKHQSKVNEATGHKRRASKEKTSESVTSYAQEITIPATPQGTSRRASADKNIPSKQGSRRSSDLGASADSHRGSEESKGSLTVKRRRPSQGSYKEAPDGEETSSVVREIPPLPSKRNKRFTYSSREALEELQGRVIIPAENEAQRLRRGTKKRSSISSSDAGERQMVNPLAQGTNESQIPDQRTRFLSPPGQYRRSSNDSASKRESPNIPIKGGTPERRGSTAQDVAPRLERNGRRGSRSSERDSLLRVGTEDPSPGIAERDRTPVVDKSRSKPSQISGSTGHGEEKRLAGDLLRELFRKTPAVDRDAVAARKENIPRAPPTSSKEKGQHHSSMQKDYVDDLEVLQTVKGDRRKEKVSGEQEEFTGTSSKNDRSGSMTTVSGGRRSWLFRNRPSQVSGQEGPFKGSMKERGTKNPENSPANEEVLPAKNKRTSFGLIRPVNKPMRGWGKSRASLGENERSREATPVSASTLASSATRQQGVPTQGTETKPKRPSVLLAPRSTAPMRVNTSTDRRQSIAQTPPPNRRQSIAQTPPPNRRQSIAQTPPPNRRQSIAQSPPVNRRQSIAAGSSVDNRQSSSVQQYQNRSTRPSTAPEQSSVT